MAAHPRPRVQIHGTPSAAWTFQAEYQCSYIIPENPTPKPKYPKQDWTALNRLIEDERPITEEEYAQYHRRMEWVEWMMNCPFMMQIYCTIWEVDYDNLYLDSFLTRNRHHPHKYHVTLMNPSYTGHYPLFIF
jgi:hypothetical protein